MKAAILGTGSWATSFGRHLAHKWDEVVLWGIVAEQVDAINNTGTNPTYLGELTLPPNLRATTKMDDALVGADAVFVVVPSQAVREVCRQAKASSALRQGVPFINLAKGLDLETLQPLSTVIAEEIGGTADAEAYPVAVLLGPSHAEEVAREMPTAVVLAGRPGHDWRHLQDWISGPFFRVYTNDDLAGVEISSAFKNVIAVAVGIADGLGMGDNTRGMLMTRGLAEMTRIGVALGGRQETFYGLAGIGDLITTCISRHSRNRNFGEAVGKGDREPQDILADSVQVVEGVTMTQAALKLSGKLGIELPITKQVHDVLYAGVAPRLALRELMEREPRSEQD